MGKRMSSLEVVWFCVFYGSVLLAFSHLPKGEGR